MMNPQERISNGQRPEWHVQLEVQMTQGGIYF